MGLWIESWRLTTLLTDRKTTDSRKNKRWLTTNRFAWKIDRTVNPACCTGWPYEQDVCLTCAMCASACPVAGVDDYDPRKMVRMVSLGMVDEVARSRWPWICTMCGKCEQCCPMGIDIADITRRIRSMRDGKRVPGILHKGLTAALETGNNLSLPKEDFIFILEDVGEEIAEEPGFEGFQCAHRQKGCTTAHHCPQQTGQHPHRRPQAVVEDLPCRR
jgi:ferredoxin